jgi:DNA-binding response OmpR family regulator
MPRILVIDDDEPLRSVLCRALERAGYDALEAADGRAALEVLRLQDGRVDVIVTDIVMPDMEGIELIMSLRKTHPSLPVIAMSGGGRSSPHGYLQIARGAGAVSVLAKPFEIQTLLTTVKALLDGSTPPG